MANYYTDYIVPDAPDAVVIPAQKKPLSRTSQKVFERDGWKCRGCGVAHNLTIDHIIPKSRGGKNSMDNYQTLCKACNLAKGDRY